VWRTNVRDIDVRHTDAWDTDVGHRNTDAWDTDVGHIDIKRASRSKKCKC
jgi:hypothetical protein